MNIRFVNWWKYWKQESKEIHWIKFAITLNGFMEGTHYFRIDIHLLNFGLIIRI